jgi:hypothetical protein
MIESSDRQHVGEVVREFSAVHRVPYNSIIAKAYWEALQDLTREQFDQAAAKLRKESDWMPRPSHFRRACRIEWT